MCYLAGTTSARVRMSQPSSDAPADEVIWMISNDSEWAGHFATRQSQSSPHIEADGCPLLAS